jgi:hypothetical protein
MEEIICTKILPFVNLGIVVGSLLLVSKRINSIIISGKCECNVLFRLSNRFIYIEYSNTQNKIKKVNKNIPNYIQIVSIRSSSIRDLLENSIRKITIILDSFKKTKYYILKKYHFACKNIEYFDPYMGLTFTGRIDPTSIETIMRSAMTCVPNKDEYMLDSNYYGVGKTPEKLITPYSLNETCTRRNLFEFLDFYLEYNKIFQNKLYNPELMMRDNDYNKPSTYFGLNINTNRLIKIFQQKRLFGNSYSKPGVYFYYDLVLICSNFEQRHTYLNPYIYNHIYKLSTVYLVGSATITDTPHDIDMAVLPNTGVSFSEAVEEICLLLINKTHENITFTNYSATFVNNDYVKFDIFLITRPICDIVIDFHMPVIRQFYTLGKKPQYYTSYTCSLCNDLNLIPYQYIKYSISNKKTIYNIIKTYITYGFNFILLKKDFDEMNIDYDTLTDIRSPSLLNFFNTPKLRIIKNI